MKSACRRTAWYGAAGLVLATALAAVFRFWQLDRIPPGFHYDEALEALEAWRVITQPGYHPVFFAGDFGVEPMFIYLTSVAFQLFGQTPLVMRGVAALVGTLTVPALYALGRELAYADRRIPASTPLLAAAALAVLRWHVFFSRVGIEPVLVPLFVVLVLWAFWRSLRTDAWGAWAALGVCLGLSVYTYPAGWLLPVLVAILAVGALVWRRGCSPVRGLLLAAVLACLVAGPLIWHFAHQPGQLLLRSSQVAVSASAGGVTAARGSLGENLLHTLGMFSVAGDADPRNNLPGLPVLDRPISVAFYLGLVVALRLCWPRRSPHEDAGQRTVRDSGLPALSVVLAGAVMLAATVFSEYAPHFRRALGVTPIVALLIGLGLGVVWDGGRRLAFDRHWPGLRFAAPLAVLALLAASAGFSVDAYFVRWARSADVYYAFDEGLWDIGRYVAGLPTDQPVYVTPRPATDRTLAFAWRDRPTVRRFDGRHAFVARDTAVSHDATYIVIEHEDFRGAGVLRGLYPTARETRQFLDRAGQVYARAFVVPAGATPARGPAYPLTGEQQPRWAQPAVELLGYDLDRTSHKPGESFYLQLWWHALDSAPRRNWTVFTHLLGAARPDGSRVWAGQDGLPGQGSATMPTWQAGDLVLDEYELRLPTDTPPGEYEIEVGLYDAGAGGVRAVTVGPQSADHIVLGRVRVE
jgi:4-amino-4-deoxy-L-arabinose transferase-like glycosyltransferase